MPFGLRNVPGTFQLTMNVTFSTLRWQVAFLYLDDIVIFFRSSLVHIGHVQTIRTFLYNVGATLELKKCRLFSETIDYPEHDIRPGPVEIALLSTGAIRGAKEPTNITEL